MTGIMPTIPKTGQPGDVVMLIVMSNISAPTVQENALRIFVNQAWANMPADTDLLPMWPDAAISLTPAALPAHVNAKPGQVLFARYNGGTDFEIRARLSFPDQGAIESTYYSVMKNLPLPADAKQYQPNEDGMLPIGLGLLKWNIPDFLPNLPAWMWALLAIAAGGSAYTSKKRHTQIAGAAVAWLAAAKFFKAQKQKIAL
jgi:hypothetical protein